MKSELVLIEECIEEKTKEYHRVAAELDSLFEGPSSSLANTRNITAKFLATQNVEKIQQELEILQAKRTQLLSDNMEEEVIEGSKEEVLQYLLNLPDGRYKLLKIIERESHGEG